MCEPWRERVCERGSARQRERDGASGTLCECEREIGDMGFSAAFLDEPDIFKKKPLFSQKEPTFSSRLLKPR